MEFDPNGNFVPKGYTVDDFIRDTEHYNKPAKELISPDLFIFPKNKKQIRVENRDKLYTDKSLELDEYFVYRVDGDKRFYKVYQKIDDLLKYHADVKYLGIGRPKEPINTSKRQCPTIGKIANFEGYFCCYCRIQLYQGNYTREHLVPKSRGGTNSVKNLRPCCRDCNTEKGNFMLHTYIQLLNLKLNDYTGAELVKLQIKIRNANFLAKEIESNA